MNPTTPRKIEYLKLTSASAAAIFALDVVMPCVNFTVFLEFFDELAPTHRFSRVQNVDVLFCRKSDYFIIYYVCGLPYVRIR